MIEDTILYNGEITLCFDSGRHTYRVICKGKEYKVPSVTRITGIIDKSAPLMAWAINNTLDVCKGAIAPGTEYAEVYLEEVWNAAKRASQRIKTDAADRGKILHRIIETYVSGQRETEIAPESSIALDGTIGFLQEKGITVQHAEKRIYSRRHRFSGTLDAIGTAGTGLVLLDWKTGKHVYPEFRLQTAAYQNAWEEEFPDKPIAGRYIVRIGEDGTITPHYYPRDTYRKDLNAFLGAQKLFLRIQEIQKQKSALVVNDENL